MRGRAFRQNRDSRDYGDFQDSSGARPYSSWRKAQIRRKRNPVNPANPVPVKTRSRPRARLQVQARRGEIRRSPVAERTLREISDTIGDTVSGAFTLTLTHSIPTACRAATIGTLIKFLAGLQKRPFRYIIQNGGRQSALRGMARRLSGLQKPYLSILFKRAVVNPLSGDIPYTRR